MFKKLKIRIETTVPYKIYKTFVTKETLITYLEPHCITAFEKDFKSVGTFLSINDVKVVTTPAINSKQLHLINLSIDAQIFIVAVVVNELVLGLVERIDESCNLLVDTGFHKIQVHHSQINANCLYNYHKNQIEFNKKSIKLGDLLKVKILEKFITDGRYLKIRGTIKGSTLGKKAWWN